MTKEIQLTQGKVALVDDEDYEYLSQWKWHAHYDGRHYYAESGINKRMGNNKNLSMHRVVIKAPDGFMVDHADGNTLNNQAYNLRICTNSQNQQNRESKNNNTIGLKGVGKLNRKLKKPYSARIYVNNKRISLGFFETAEAAAHAYDEAAKKYFGQFARTNYRMEN